MASAEEIGMRFVELLQWRHVLNADIERYNHALSRLEALAEGESEDPEVPAHIELRRREDAPADVIDLKTGEVRRSGLWPPTLGEAVAANAQMRAEEVETYVWRPTPFPASVKMSAAAEGIAAKLAAASEGVRRAFSAPGDSREVGEGDTFRLTPLADDTETRMSSEALKNE